ncbi:gamma-glutamylcyclotransferase (GGCT)/AIG2-like uncharacterized protein YtfP [Paenibacillus endophyticus]|uniref:Gamma-glutamylcyclotransferase (GGCT)/AIG2-like uncharacterized protein YtfP n=1 Tax=Paenibacillus endophyticus TaxID=1294268 RepID=A0A7W5GCQ0_9BACL|nr:gamma-glutamylcyclotransferase family protein [Paenibacillus endophyticus]MBB3154242.1 gamma-glutamylcyclotransferase (GGCT)/AIG2-like uncharacterized protein YtfP [Paenibacillus endophyticus]
MSSLFVFVYGSLLPGQSNHHIIFPHLLACKEGWIAARLVDCGAYPAAVRDEIAIRRNSIIRGQWIAVDRAGVAAMDRLEEFYGIEEQNDYERVWLPDAKDATIAGWSYVWESTRGYPVVGLDYWPDYQAGKQRHRE